MCSASLSFDCIVSSLGWLATPGSGTAYILIYALALESWEGPPPGFEY